MRNFFCIIPLLIILASCNCAVRERTKPLTRCSRSPETEEISNIVISISRELLEEHDLFLYDSRVVFDEKIKRIRIDYTSQMSVELCEARELLVEIVDKLEKRMSGHSTLRAAFNHRPVTYEDLEIHITFDSFFNKYVDSNYMAYIILEKGWAYFYSSELNVPFTDVWMQKVEPFYQTRQFVKFTKEAELPYQEREEEVKKKQPLQEERLYIDETTPTKTFGI